MWLIGFGLAVLSYWRHAGALYAFGLVLFEISSGHDSTTPVRTFCIQGYLSGR
jgi:hypothetical protein